MSVRRRREEIEQGTFKLIASISPRMRIQCLEAGNFKDGESEECKVLSGWSFLLFSREQVLSLLLGVAMAAC